MKGQKSGKIVLWIFSVMFILGSLGGFSSGQVIAGIALMLFGLSLCPLIWKLAEKMGGNNIKRLKIVFPIFFFVLSMVTMGSVPEDKQKTKDVITTEQATAKVTEVQSESVTQSETQQPITAAPTEKSTENETPEETQALTETEPPVNHGVAVHFIDVGQADCILIESNKHFMLVDAGNNDDADTIVSYLNEQGVKKLDYVIGTHPHEDHIGSLGTVINTYDIGTLIMTPKVDTTKTFEDVVTAIKNKGLNVNAPVVGKTYYIGDSTFTILSPDPNNDYGDEYNNWSVGIKLTNGSKSFVMYGDAGAEAEQDILKTDIDLRADVLKLGDHGSDTSATDSFLDTVQPKYAVISCGKDNEYGYPHQKTMDKMVSRNIEVFRTDEQGTIIASCDGNSITWNNNPSTSMAAGQQTESTQTETMQTDPIPETQATEPVTEAQPVGMDYIININTGKFHYPSCSSVKQMNESNKKFYNGSSDDLVSQGYSPCGRCKP